MENTKTVRITKAMRYTDIINLLTSTPVVHGTTIDDAVEFIHKEMELISKKNNSKSDKITAAQEKNAEYRAQILEFLATQEEGKTCTEIGRGIPSLADFNNQKIAALLKALITDGKVRKEVKGSKAPLFYFN